MNKKDDESLIYHSEENERKEENVPRPLPSSSPNELRESLEGNEEIKGKDFLRLFPRTYQTEMICETREDDSGIKREDSSSLICRSDRTEISKIHCLEKDDEIKGEAFRRLIPRSNPNAWQTSLEDRQSKWSSSSRSSTEDSERNKDQIVAQTSEAAAEEKEEKETDPPGHIPWSNRNEMRATNKDFKERHSAWTSMEKLEPLSTENAALYEEKKEHKGDDSSKLIPWPNRNEMQMSLEGRKTIRDLDAKDGKLVNSPRILPLSKPNGVQANRAGRKTLQDLETKDSKMTDSTQIVSLSSQNGIRASRDGRITLQELEAEERIDKLYKGTTGCGQVVSSTRGEDASPSEVALGSQGHHPDTNEERLSEEQHPSVSRERHRWTQESIIPGSFRVTNLDNEDGCEEDDHTIMYRMGSESALSTIFSQDSHADEESQQIPDRISQNEHSSPVVAQFISKKGRRRIIASTVLLSILVVAVGVGIVISSEENDGGDGFQNCDFTDVGQLLRCECNQDKTKWPEDVNLRYQFLLSTVIPEVIPDFVELATSCAPSNLALIWLATDDYSSAMTDIATLTNRFVLALLFQTWMGSTWKTNDGWLSSQSECTWYGITCNGTAITGIELGDNFLRSGLEDGLPTELFTLTSLKTFNASDSFLSGNIQSEIRSLINLEMLDLGSLQSSLGQYPNELFALPKLRVLHLSYPTEGGNIPTTVGLATRLESFIASGAGLVGTLPSELGLMTSLVKLSFDTNGLSGTCPTEIGLLPNLKMLILSYNRIEGNIPTEFGALSSLLSLDLGYNALRGSIPIEVASLPHLQMFRLRENRLTGTVPEEVLASGELECFDASSNRMDNYVPQGVCPTETTAGSLFTVCYNFDDQACSCCTCLSESAPEDTDYCSQVQFLN